MNSTCRRISCRILEWNNFTIFDFFHFYNKNIRRLHIQIAERLKSIENETTRQELKFVFTIRFFLKRHCHRGWESLTLFNPHGSKIFEYVLGSIATNSIGKTNLIESRFTYVKLFAFVPCLWCTINEFYFYNGFIKSHYYLQNNIFQKFPWSIFGVD